MIFTQLHQSQGFNPVSPKRMIHQNGFMNSMRGLGQRVRNVRETTSPLRWFGRITTAPIWVPLWLGWKGLQGVNALSKEVIETVSTYAPGGAKKTIETTRNLVGSTISDTWELGFSHLEEQAKATLNYGTRMSIHNFRLGLKTVLSPFSETLKGLANTAAEVVRSPFSLVSGTRAALNQVLVQTPKALFKEKDLAKAGSELLKGPGMFIEHNTRDIRALAATPFKAGKAGINSGMELVENNVNAHTGFARGLVNGFRRQIDALTSIKDHSSSLMDTMTLNKSFNSPTGHSYA